MIRRPGHSPDKGLRKPQGSGTFSRSWELSAMSTPALPWAHKLKTKKKDLLSPLGTHPCPQEQPLSLSRWVSVGPLFPSTPPQKPLLYLVPTQPAVFWGPFSCLLLGATGFARGSLCGTCHGHTCLPHCGCFEATKMTVENMEPLREAVRVTSGQ